jgi:hypothetical protein
MKTCRMLSMLFTGTLASVYVSAAEPQVPVQASNAAVAGKPAASPTSSTVDASSIERGRYLVRISGCNDCHTPDYPQRGGDMPEAAWLMGSNVGFNGPWGTSYPSNLRLTVGSMTEEQWLKYARLPRLPPMPWFSLAAMTDEDLRALYRFIASLRPRGERAPTTLAAGQESKTPFIPFYPHEPQIAKR